MFQLVSIRQSGNAIVLNRELCIARRIRLHHGRLQLMPPTMPYADNVQNRSAHHLASRTSVRSNVPASGARILSLVKQNSSSIHELYTKLSSSLLIFQLLLICVSFLDINTHTNIMKHKVQCSIDRANENASWSLLQSSSTLNVFQATNQQLLDARNSQELFPTVPNLTI